MYWPKLFFLQILSFPDSFIHAIHDTENEPQGTTQKLTDNLEKWNNICLNSLAPQILATATLLNNVNNNVNNLQQRAHIWDTFQSHITAWNDQLTTLDRKANIISKGQEKLLALEWKLNIFPDLETKLHSVVKSFKSIQESLSTLKEENQNAYSHRNHNILNGEFAVRGILSKIKMTEKKLDRLLIAQQNKLNGQRAVDENPKLTIKSNTPQFAEDLLNDISSKVDVIFDKINNKEENDNDFADDYQNDGVTPADNDTVIKTDQEPQLNAVTKSSSIISERLYKLENYSKKIFENQNAILEKVQQCVDKDKLNEYIITYLKDFLETNTKRKICSAEEDIGNLTFYEPNKQSCEDLNGYFKSGVYIFDNQTSYNNFSYNTRYCYFRDNQFWTVIQRRGNFPKQNFNESWNEYKNGFGSIHKDFWFGNNNINRLSKENTLVLRVELEDFNGNYVWAEYDTFMVQPEKQNFRIIVANYRGNATDSFSSHNGSYFSTYDRKNDQAPECCPCAVSYGGGWWFNSCFESNLNGVYHNKGEYNAYYEGIIWESWLGNYSLKKTLMMVKAATKQAFTTSTLWPYYEDP